MDESVFLQWYRERAKRFGIDPNPDDPGHHYDYRAAYAAGAEPDKTGHWPSEFKTDLHPRRFLVLDGVPTDTKTGEEVARRRAAFLFSRSALRGPQP